VQLQYQYVKGNRGFACKYTVWKQFAHSENWSSTGIWKEIFKFKEVYKIYVDELV
jgi:hypothetical protein